MGTHREQLAQRTNLTCPRPFLLRPPERLFLVCRREREPGEQSQPDGPVIKGWDKACADRRRADGTTVEGWRRGRGGGGWKNAKGRRAGPASQQGRGMEQGKRRREDWAKNCNGPMRRSPAPVVLGKRALGACGWLAGRWAGWAKAGGEGNEPWWMSSAS